MNMSIRYYWLKLPNDFFNDVAIKRLRKLAGGDTYTIIYLKMMLQSLKDDGKMYYEGIEKSFAEEVALLIDEDAENVQVTIQYLISIGLLECCDDEATLIQVGEMVGSETEDARKTRFYRRKKNLLDEPEKKQLGRFVKPTVEDVQKYCKERNNNVDAQSFVDFYTSKGWMVGKNPMKDWKACVRTWEKNNRPKQQARLEFQAPNYAKAEQESSSIQMTEEQKAKMLELQRKMGGNNVK